MELFEGKNKRRQYEVEYKSQGLRYKGLKEDLAQAIYKELAPIQERRRRFEKNPKLIAEILEDGRRYCAKIAKETLLEVKKAMGLV